MLNPFDALKPNDQQFREDPFGYANSAFLKWGLLQNIAGHHVNIENVPNDLALKDPVLWMSQAFALAQTAIVVLNSEPEFEGIPKEVHGISHCQYKAISLMLVGLSLEVALKASALIQKGVAGFKNAEGKYRTHKLEKLTEYIEDLSEKDVVILRLLTHFVEWAGRYPDPGSSRENQYISIFKQSEKYKITGKDVFELATRIHKQVAGKVGR